MTEPRRALVTGGSRGIGRAVAERLAADSFEVVLTWCRNQARADEVAEAIRAAGGRATVEKLDLADPESIADLARRLGPDGVDVLVNNGGEIRDAILVFQKEEDLRHVIEVNLIGAMLLTKRILHPMFRRRWGRVVNVASDSGLTGNAGQTNYSAAKGGLISFTKSLAREVASFGITVNAVAPGFVETDILADLPASKRESASRSVPLGRFGRPEEVAGPVAWLASDAAAYLTGIVLRIDGGLAA